MQVLMSPIAPRWAWTEGLSEIEQQELAIPLDWPLHDPHDQQVTDLLVYLSTYVNAEAQRLQADETMVYGWTALGFRHSDAQDAIGPGFLVVRELADPLAAAATDWIDGVAQALALLQRQAATLQRNHVTGELDPPHRSDRAFACTRMPPLGFLWRYPVFAARFAHEQAEESGWFFGCYEQGHDHEDLREREEITLQQIASALPRLLDYLALPVGVSIICTAMQTVIFRPDDEEGYLDPLAAE